MFLSVTVKHPVTSRIDPITPLVVCVSRPETEGQIIILELI